MSYKCFAVQFLWEGKKWFRKAGKVFNAQGRRRHRGLDTEKVSRARLSDSLHKEAPEGNTLALLPSQPQL
jgi:hypothetical protein